MDGRTALMAGGSRQGGGGQKEGKEKENDGDTGSSLRHMTVLSEGSNPASSMEGESPCEGR
jgi:hypothetical protein